MVKANREIDGHFGIESLAGRQGKIDDGVSRVDECKRIEVFEAQ